jgi:hypothetical protein
MAAPLARHLQVGPVFTGNEPAKQTAIDEDVHQHRPVRRGHVLAPEMHDLPIQAVDIALDRGVGARREWD